MRALITGGCGFIGSHLAEALLGAGAVVDVVDDLSTGDPANLGSLRETGRLNLFAHSVLDAEALAPRVAAADVVFHLAAAVGVKLVIEQPVRTIETIVAGTDAVLRLAATHRRPVLITSSSEVYGKGASVPFAEGDDVVLGATTRRRWAYACAKMLDEFLALAHWHESRLPVTCVRLFNTVGPRQTGRYGMVLPRFVQQALAGDPITVYGDGEQTRCFCHVADVVEALEALAACPDAAGKVVNIGNAEEVTINALAERVRRVVGSASPIVHVPYDEAYLSGFEDMRRRVPDLSLARTLIGFTPERDLDTMIAEAAAYWRSFRDED